MAYTDRPLPPSILGSQNADGPMLLSVLVCCDTGIFSCLTSLVAWMQLNSPDQQVRVQEASAAQHSLLLGHRQLLPHSVLCIQSQYHTFTCAWVHLTQICVQISKKKCMNYRSECSVFCSLVHEPLECFFYCFFRICLYFRVYDLCTG